jgi:hypothetical protein
LQLIQILLAISADIQPMIANTMLQKKFTPAMLHLFLMAGMDPWQRDPDMTSISLM